MQDVKMHSGPDPVCNIKNVFELLTLQDLLGSWSVQTSHRIANTPSSQEGRTGSKICPKLNLVHYIYPQFSPLYRAPKNIHSGNETSRVQSMYTVSRVSIPGYCSLWSIDCLRCSDWVRGWVSMKLLGLIVIEPKWNAEIIIISYTSGFPAC